MRKRSKPWRLLEIVFLLLFAAILAVILRRVVLTARREAEQREAAETMARLVDALTGDPGATRAPDPTPELTEDPEPEATEFSQVAEAPEETPEPTEDPEPDATEFSQVAEAPEETPTPEATKKAAKASKKGGKKAKATAAPRNTPNPEMLLEAQAKLKENTDYVGTLSFGETAMYVCQYKNNTYYATHRFDKAKDKGGMVYMDCRCDSWPLSDNTVLYGHNMRDGTRFGLLQHFLDAGFLQKHPRVRFASLYNVRTYAPIAIMRLSIDPSHEDYLEFDRIHFDSEADFNVYLDGIRARSLLRLNDVEVKYGDRLLTLATCSEDYDGGRLVVVCVEIDG